MSVLIFAPQQPDLPALSNEVAALVRCFHRPILVHGPATEADLRRALTPDIEGFWFAGHAGADGIRLSNGAALSPQALTQYLSAADVQWSFFNSCESDQFVQQIQANYPHDIFASITDISDETAGRTAALMAMNYSHTGDILRAFQVASPAGSTPLRYFPSPVIAATKGKKKWMTAG